MDRIGESDRLWLEREPSVEEVKKEFEKFDMTQYNEVVFCGFGEPTERFDALKEIAAFVKEKYNKPIRINTNGAGSLINRTGIKGTCRHGIRQLKPSGKRGVFKARQK